MFNTRVNIGNFLNDVVFIRSLALHLKDREKQYSGNYVYFNRIETIDENWFFNERGFIMEDNI